MDMLIIYLVSTLLFSSILEDVAVWQLSFRYFDRHMNSSRFYARISQTEEMKLLKNFVAINISGYAVAMIKC